LNNEGIADVFNNAVGTAKGKLADCLKINSKLLVNLHSEADSTLVVVGLPLKGNSHRFEIKFTVKDNDITLIEPEIMFKISGLDQDGVEDDITNSIVTLVREVS
jgi:hypothetical protein